MNGAEYVDYILDGKPATKRAISYLDELTAVLERTRQDLRFATEAMPGAHENRDASKLADKLAAQTIERANAMTEEGEWLKAAQLRLIGIALMRDAAWQARRD